MESFTSEENRGDPGSLPRLWPVKFVIPVAFLLLVISALTVILKELQVLLDEDNNHGQGKANP